MKLDRVIAVRTRKTIYRDGDKCIKVFQQPYSKTAIFNEAANHAMVEETGLDIPKVLGVTMLEGKWAIVTEFIHGKTVEQLITEHPEKKETYYRTMADLQSAIHKKECPVLYRLKDELNQKICNAELDATTRYDLHCRLEHMAKGMAICHGDFVPSNVILSEDGIYYTIDWTLASYGNPLADVAQTYIILWMQGSYADAELYLELYCAEGRVDKEAVYAWLPIIGAAMSIRRPLNERSILLDCVNSGDFHGTMQRYPMGSQK